MNERIRELIAQATKVVEPNDPDYRHEIFDKEKFAELIIRECIQVAANQRNPSNLNYKPSERFVEDLKLHFGVAE